MTMCIARISFVNPRIHRLLIVFTDGRKLELNARDRAFYAEFAALAKAGKRIPVTQGIESYELKG